MNALQAQNISARQAAVKQEENIKLKKELEEAAKHIEELDKLRVLAKKTYDEFSDTECIKEAVAVAQSSELSVSETLQVTTPEPSITATRCMHTVWPCDTSRQN